MSKPKKNNQNVSNSVSFAIYVAATFSFVWIPSSYTENDNCYFDFSP